MLQDEEVMPSSLMSAALSHMTRKVRNAPQPPHEVVPIESKVDCGKCQFFYLT